MNRFRSKSLFWEWRDYQISPNEEDLAPIFTIKDYAHTVKNKDLGLITYPSLREVYLSYDHVPYNEYEFAIDVFNSWEHWKYLCNVSSLTKPLVASWREELTVRLKANAVKQILKVARSDTPASLSAARYISDEGYTIKKVGRITKEEKERELKIAAGVRDTLASDMDRLGLTLTVGGKQ